MDWDAPWEMKSVVIVPLAARALGIKWRKLESPTPKIASITTANVPTGKTDFFTLSVQGYPNFQGAD
jgi:hypothetical protein